MMPQWGPRRDQLQQIGEFVDRTLASLALRRETLGEFTTIALAALLEHDEITQQDAAIAADAVGHNFTLVEELVEVGATYSETLRGLARTEHSLRGNSGEVIAGAHAIDHALQEITHLGTDAGSGELVERVDLLSGDSVGVDGLHASDPFTSR